jgi:hypothetical protein
LSLILKKACQSTDRQAFHVAGTRVELVTFGL